MSWYTYILQCSDSTFYTGITNNLDKRVIIHNKRKGARYTARRVPVTLVWYEVHPDRSNAQKREIEVKDWRQERKLTLIKNFKTDTS